MLTLTSNSNWNYDSFELWTEESKRPNCANALWYRNAPNVWRHEITIINSIDAVRKCWAMTEITNPYFTICGKESLTFKYQFFVDGDTIGNAKGAPSMVPFEEKQLLQLDNSRSRLLRYQQIRVLLERIFLLGSYNSRKLITSRAGRPASSSFKSCEIFGSCSQAEEHFSPRSSQVAGKRRLLNIDSSKSLSRMLTTKHLFGNRIFSRFLNSQRTRQPFFANTRTTEQFGIKDSQRTPSAEVDHLSIMSDNRN
jgi:hypothetical protein